MDNQTPPPNKKLFYGAIAVVCVIIVFIFISILTNNPSKRTTPLTTTTTKNSNDTNKQNPDLSLPSQGTQASVNTYKNTLFSVNYPLDWKVQELQLANGGFSVRINPSISKDPQARSMIIIADSISSVPSIKQKQEAFLKQGFTSSTTLVDSLQANKITGIFPPVRKTATPSSAASALQINHVYLDRGNYSYLFDYSYISKGVNQQIESEFAKIISSFKFVK